MQLIERDHPGQRIEEIMLAAFRQHGSERAAARALGIRQQTYTLWKYRLGLEHTIDALRLQRIDEEMAS